MTHSPARVLAQLLVDLTQGTAPSTEGDWPVYSENEPPSPDNCITTYNRDGGPNFRYQPTGEFMGNPGLQVRVRSTGPASGWLKTDQILNALSGVYKVRVTVDTSVYLVHCLSNIGDVLSLGKEAPTSKRNLHTLNMTMSVRQCS